MVKESAKHGNGGWRKALIGLLIVLGCLCLGLAVIGGWARGLLFNTDKWVETVAPLPKQPEVSQALATYANDAAFKSVDVEAEIRSVLPPNAAFLAPPLATELRDRTQARTQQFVESDQFQTIWTSANRFAHQRFVNFVDRGPRQAPEDAQLKLQGLVAKAKEFANQPVAAPVQAEPKADFAKLHQARGILHRIKESPALMPALAAMFLLLALMISRRRWSTLLVLAIGMALTAVIVLLALKALRPEVSGLANGSLNQSAVGVIWDEVTDQVRASSVWILAGGVALLILSLVAGRYRRETGVEYLSQRAPGSFVGQVRGFFGHHSLLASLLGAGATVAILLGTATVTLATIVAAIAWFVAYLAALRIVAIPQS